MNRRYARSFVLLLRLLLVLSMLVALAPPLAAAPQVNIKLNHALEANKPVLDFRVSPDGLRVVYRVARTLPPLQDAPPPPSADLYSVPANGGTAIQLNTPATSEVESVESYQFSPDGSQVIYLRIATDATLGNVLELFSVAVDGSSAPVTVSGPIPVGSRNPRDFVVEFESADITLPTGDGTVRSINYTLRHEDVPERITSINDGTSNTFFFGEQPNNLVQQPIGGSRRQLNPGLTSGGVVYDFVITPDGTRAIYRADQNLDGTIELFSVPADGSDTGFRISGPMVAGGDVLSFKVNSTSSRAVYLADQTTNGVVELYSARTNGGIVTKLNAPLTSGGAVTQFAFSPDGNLVVYLADQIVNERFQLFGVATTGSTPVLLSPSFTVGSVRSFVISPDGERIFFVENTGPGGTLRLYERFSGVQFTTITASIGPPVANLTVPDVKVSPDGSHVVYLADAGSDGIFELTSLHFTPAQVAVPQLNAPLVAGGNIRGFKISPDGERVVYVADQESAGVFELYTVPIGGGSVDKINGPLVAGGGVLAGSLDFQFSPDGSVVYYLADQDTDGLTELYAAFDAPLVSFTQAGYVVAEDGSLATQLAVQRSGNLAAPGSVRVQLTGAPEGGTATGGASLANPAVDFVDNVRDVSFAAHEMTKTIPVPIQNDGVAEAAETFTMQLFEAEQTVISGTESAEVVILDTASAPLLEDASLALPENSANDTPVPTTAAAISIGAVEVTTYTILSGNTNNAFRINNSGELFVNNSAALNFEITPVFVLLVEARTDGGSSDVATWTITLQNQNEAPLFLAQTRSVAENSLNGSLVGTRLIASDPDGDPLSFALTSDVFRIRANGQLEVKDGTKLDFETQKTHTLNVSVTDGQGHTVNAAITVNVLDVLESDPTLPTITSLSPASAVAGGKDFLLVVSGKNFSANSVVRWNGGERKTTLLKGALYAAISAQDIANVTEVKIDVVDSATKQLSNVVVYRVVLLKVGIAELSVSPSGVQHSAVGQRTIFTLRWTHTTEPWRTMDEMDMRLTDGESIPLWVRYQETRDENGQDISTIFLLNADGTVAGSGRFGEAKVLENETVRLDLANATFVGSGDTGSTIVVNVPVFFKSAAVQDGAYTIEMYGVDDIGGEQGPNVMGSWSVTTPHTYLPQMER